jgi:hypothetical protein
MNPVRRDWVLSGLSVRSSERRWSIVAKPLKPGTPAPQSGQYREVGKRTEITSTQGNPLPPTSRPGTGYVLVDKTKHKSK